MNPGHPPAGAARFAILEHTGAPDDPAGRHYDLLLETAAACRTWRLAALPSPDGPPVPAVELPPHRLAWLDHVAGAVSGGRGFARRIDAGEYDGWTAKEPMARMVAVRLHGVRIHGVLVLEPAAEGWMARLAVTRPAGGSAYDASRSPSRSPSPEERP